MASEVPGKKRMHRPPLMPKRFAQHSILTHHQIEEGLRISPVRFERLIDSCSNKQILHSGYCEFNGLRMAPPIKVAGAGTAAADLSMVSLPTTPLNLGQAIGQTVLQPMPSLSGTNKNFASF